MAKGNSSSTAQAERQYHDTQAAYVLPNDEIEQDRLDAQASAIVEMIGGHPCLAPTLSMVGMLKAVDVGCGTGIATMQIAEMFPSATVHGVDLSDVPTAVQKIAPPNIVWTKGNILDIRYEDDTGRMSASTEPVAQIFKPGSLNYIFGRMLFLGINDWHRYFSTSARALKSGGIIEHQDLDWAFYRTATSQRLDNEWEWHRAVMSALKKTGLSPQAGSNAAELMKASGLEIISMQTFEFSFVPCEKAFNSIAMGHYVQQKLVPQYPELLRKMLEIDGITGSRIKDLTDQALNDISSEKGIHQKYTVTVARKP
ncbi:S-adenosyl-L-methionine-dependent methyltransferase [Coniella lustricola]|uniref:S-adenosyl-L-methionine-dependent methyltransferase n=1 Tax=Coniella lustricola TaxID=2025994 RepID=A0A2T3A6Y8_9PEZI|nr:S-adenosyl-L-methionine-dependent methyltransferase [Coniella lustricola]